jgi:hypothetical protein
MSLSEISKDNPDASCRLSELAKHAGITHEQARDAFYWMIENAFATGMLHNDGPDANVTITVKGADEAERLRLPMWKRFLLGDNMRYVGIGIASGVIGGIISGVVVGVILKFIP